jgi:hypothetical protein
MKFNTPTISKIPFYKSLDLISKLQFRFEFLNVYYFQICRYIEKLIATIPLLDAFSGNVDFSKTKLYSKLIHPFLLHWNVCIGMKKGLV